MPYAMETGPYLSLLEDFVNADRTRAVDALLLLQERDPERLVTDIFSEHPFSPLRDGPEHRRTVAEVTEHINKNWFGLIEDPDQPGRYVQPAPPGDDGLPRNWPWDYWWGDVQAIVRATLIRALEVSLGVAHDAKPAPRSRQHWPISLRAVCGLRWWEGWVSWRKLARGGYVDVVFLTPSHAHAVEPTLLRPSPEKKSDPGTGYVVEPLKADGHEGLWVIGAILEEKRDPKPTKLGWSRQGEITFPPFGPKFFAQPDHKFITVSPPEGQGGVLPGGRPYTTAVR
jgi:hypothetical protein